MSSSKDGNTSDHLSLDKNVMSIPMTLERKLELLESRFTQPTMPGGGKAASSVGSHSPSGSFVPAVFGQTQVHSTTNNSHNSQNHHSDSSGNNSEHSFSFATPLSRPPSESSNLPPSAVRSKRRPSLQSSFHAVDIATTRHLRKLQANSPIQGMSSNNLKGVLNTSSATSATISTTTATTTHPSTTMMSSMLVLQQDGTRSLSGLPSSSSASTTSNQTLLTSHVRGQKNLPSHPRGGMVADSPPVLVSPANGGMTPTPNPTANNSTNNTNITIANTNSLMSQGMAVPKPAAARSLLLASTNPSTSNQSGSQVRINISI